jgi:glucosamine-6-phosphate deaminase
MSEGETVLLEASWKSQPAIEVLKDLETVGRRSAEIIAQRLRAEPATVLLLPTGRTPLAMYRRLVDMHHRADLSFARATFFNLDEYLGLTADHPSNYRHYMQKHFFESVDAYPEKIHIPDGRTVSYEAECRRYEEAIESAGGIDLCVLGIGRNGHIGFNEPGSSCASRTRVVRLTDTTRRANAADFDGGRVPELAITVGMRTILESKEIILLASGEGKARAVADAVRGEISEQVPASLLKLHNAATFLLDQEAAGELGELKI